MTKEEINARILEELIVSILADTNITAEELASWIPADDQEDCFYK